MTLIDNLVSYWKLDDAYTESTWVDSHGPNNLTKSGTLTDLPSAIINSGAGHLNALSAGYLYINDANQSGLDISGDLTISCWCRILVTPTSYPGMICKAPSNNQANYQTFYSQNDTGKVIFRTGDGSASHDLASTYAVADIKDWHHWVFTYETSTKEKRIYTDGSPNGSATTTHGATLYDNTADFYLGRETVGFASLDREKDMDEVGIWNRVLTEAEVTELYNGGAGLAYPFGGAAIDNSKFFMVF